MLRSLKYLTLTTNTLLLKQCISFFIFNRLDSLLQVATDSKYLCSISVLSMIQYIFWLFVKLKPSILHTLTSCFVSNPTHMIQPMKTAFKRNIYVNFINFPMIVIFNRLSCFPFLSFWLDFLSIFILILYCGIFEINVRDIKFPAMVCFVMSQGRIILEKYWSGSGMLWLVISLLQR